MPEEAADFFEAYFSFAGDCEVPTIYTRWCAIAGIGAVLGRQFWMTHGTSKIFPNQYIMLIGSPGTRKDTAVNMMRKALHYAGYDKVAATKTTKEKFIMDLEGLPQDGSKMDAAAMDKLLSENEDEVHDVLVMAGEFGEFMGYGNAEFISLLTTLWDNLDVYDGRTKNSKSALVYQPTVSIVGGATHSSFALTFPSEVIGQGFMSRLLLVFAEPVGRRITFPAVRTNEQWLQVASFIQRIQRDVYGEVEFTDDAREALDDIYQTWVDLDDARFRHYSNRRLTHLFKLCMVCAAARISRKITRSDVVYANSMLTHIENLMPRALGEFGKSKHADVAAKVLDFLEQRVLPCTVQDIWKVVATDLEKMADLAHILQSLEQAEKIQRANKTGFLPRKKPAKPDSQYIDYSLLRECKQ